ncbi:MAG: ACP S-malonyltransferase [Isosphaeraceae bacterium]
MRGILADINVGKQRRAILGIWASDTWRDLWNNLGLSVVSFPAVGLSYDSPDTVIWRTCQREQLVLITGNRNDDGPDSLEAVIRDENQPDSLPVITFANPNRVLQDRVYAEEVAERLLDYLMRINEVRGAGRLYVP